MIVMRFIVVYVRHPLNCKKEKGDECPVRKPNAYSAQEVSFCLSNASNPEDFKDETCTMPLSKSLVGGSINICKLRVLNFVHAEDVLQGLLIARVQWPSCILLYQNIDKF